MKKLLSLLSLLFIFSQKSYGMFAQRALIAAKNAVRTASHKAQPNKRISLQEARNLLSMRFSQLVLLRHEIAHHRNEHIEDVELDMHFINEDFEKILSRLSNQKQKKTDPKKN